MTRDRASYDQKTTKAAATDPKATQTPADEVVAVLLDLLRRTENEVRPRDLEGKAKAAVDTYRRISLDLEVRRFLG